MRRKNATIKFSNAYHIHDSSWHDPFITTSVAFTAVFGNNLEELSKDLVVALNKRYLENPEQSLTIITCENKTDAAWFLKDCVLKKIGSEKEAWLSKHVGFSESIIFKTCLDASAKQSP